MKRIVLALCAVAMAAPAFSQTYVKGYTRRDGTYVAPHYRSSPNRSTLDNYSTRGNINPFTGKVGTVRPYTPPSYGYLPYVSPKPPSLYSDESEDDPD